MSPSSFHINTGNCFFPGEKSNKSLIYKPHSDSTTGVKFRAWPHCYVTNQRAEVISTMSVVAAMHFTWFCFLSLQPKGFRRYYSSPLLIHEQFGCIKEVMPIGRFRLLFHSVSLWQCSATAAADFQPWYLPSAAFQLLSVTGCPSAISGKDHFKDTKLEEERVCLLCVSLKTLCISPLSNYPIYNNNYLSSK